MKANHGAALNRTAHCLTILSGIQQPTKFKTYMKWAKMVSDYDTFGPQDSRYKEWKPQMTRCTVCNAHTEIFHTWIGDEALNNISGYCLEHWWMKSVTKIWGEWKACKCDKYEVNEKCISVTNIRWKKTVLYGNAEDLKQMKSLTLSCYLQMFSRVHENQTPFFSLFLRVFKKQRTTRHQREDYLLC